MLRGAVSGMTDYGFRLPEQAAHRTLCGKEYHMNCECMKQISDLSLLEPVFAEYAAVKGSLITILQHAQEIYGYLPTDVIYRIAERTGNTPARVLGVATFYTQFRFQPAGKYLIMLCDGTACHVNGSARIAAALQEYLHVENGGTTEDGLFTLDALRCIGGCSIAPAVSINGRVYPKVSVDTVPKLIEEYKARG